MYEDIELEYHKGLGTVFKDSTTPPPRRPPALAVVHPAFPTVPKPQPRNTLIPILNQEGSFCSDLYIHIQYRLHTINTSVINRIYLISAFNRGKILY